MKPKGFRNSIQHNIATASLHILAWQLRKGTKTAASIIIVTHNRATYLNLALAALERQLFPKTAWELIIVDDNSQDATSEVLDEFEQQHYLRLVRQRSSERLGRAASLNTALRLAQGRILVFVNDDRLVKPDFLLQHLLLQHNGSAVVLGDDHRLVHTHLFDPNELALNGIAPKPMQALEEINNAAIMEELTFDGKNDYGAIFTYFNSQSRLPPSPWAFFTTANASLPREMIQNVGGFDECFLGWGLEDIDLAYRLYQANQYFQYAPQCITLRQIRPSIAGRKQDMSSGINRFLTKHPRLDHGEQELIRRSRYASVG